MRGQQKHVEDIRAEGLEVGLADHVLTITLDRPAKRNAITYDMYEALTALLDHAAADSDIHCILFKGEGSIFTAGHDVSGFARGLSLAVEEKPSFGFMRALSECPKPVIAAVNGDAVGIGATMLFHCDMVYAVAGSSLIFPFMKMGLVPEFASTHFLSRVIGHQRAIELFARGGRCSVEQAAAWGMVNAVVAEGELAEVVRTAASDLALLSPAAVQETKRLMKHADRDAVRDAIGREAHCFHALLGSEFVMARLNAPGRRVS